MAKPERYLRFGNVDISGGEMVNAVCNFCGRTFIGKPNPGDRVDDVVLRMRSDFEAHHCGEDVSQAAARIVREVTQNR